MKTVNIILFCLIASVSFSQNTEGVVTYVENIDMSDKIKEMNANMDSAKKKNPERAAMMGGLTKQIEEFMKSFEKTNYQLTFKDKATLYKEKPAELTESEVNQETNYMMAYKPKSDIMYYNKEKNQKFIQKNFMGKDFLIKDTLKKQKWKIVMEQKVIKGYPCMKAVTEDTLYKVEVWFTSQIPVSSGPKGLYGLPGLILEAKFTRIYSEADKKAKGKKTSIKQFVMNGKLVVGVGNIYANEALFLAGIHPAKTVCKVSLKKMNLLVECIKRVLSEAIVQGGTTLKDFVGSDGKPGYFKQQLNVYGRAGEPCYVCKKTLQEVRQNNRSSVFCSQCQT